MSTLETNLIQPSTGTALTVGASGDTITVPSGATFNVAGTLQSGGSAITQGITMADQWRLTANLTTSVGQQFITANWERNDSTSSGTIGSAMTESSGVFSFPSTGVYLIMAGGYFVEGTSTAYYAGLNITTTEDNSSYTDRVQTYGHVYNASEHISVGLNYIFDVTNTSTHKFKLEAETQTAVTLTGDTDKDRTWVRFIRLGDT
jgi:hypothetical protein